VQNLKAELPLYDQLYLKQKEKRSRHISPNDPWPRNSSQFSVEIGINRKQHSSKTTALTSKGWTSGNLSKPERV